VVHGTSVEVGTLVSVEVPEGVTMLVAEVVGVSTLPVLDEDKDELVVTTDDEDVGVAVLVVFWNGGRVRNVELEEELVVRTLLLELVTTAELLEVVETTELEVLDVVPFKETELLVVETTELELLVVGATDELEELLTELDELELEVVATDELEELLVETELLEDEEL